MSVALLGAVGMTGAVKGGVHASQLNNGQTNVNSRLSVHNLQNQLINANQGQLRQRIDRSVQSNHQPVSLNSARVLHQADQLGTHVLQGRLNQNVSAQSAGTSNVTSNVAAQVSQPSVNASQVSQATSTASQKNHQYSLAAQEVHQVGRQIQSGHYQEINPQSVGTTLNDIDSIYNKIHNFYQDYNYSSSGAMSQASAVEKSAWAEINRYSWIDPQGLDTNPSDANYGSATAGYGFSDDSTEAINLNNDLKNSLSTVANPSLVNDSLQADVISKDASSLAQNPDKNANALNALHQEINDMSSEVASISESADSTIDQLNTTKDSIFSDFSSVAAEADSFARHFDSPFTRGTDDGTADDNKTYAVVNAYNINEYFNAVYDPYVHQINIMSNMQAWDFPDEKNRGDTPTTSNDAYYYPPAHNLNVNGLNNDGSWNTIDMAKTNINFSPGGNVFSKYNGNVTEVKAKNLRLYGTSYWGPFSSNTSSSILLDYDNIDYCGTQLAYNTDQVSGIFEGKIRANCGATYSPDGAYSSYGYDSGGLSPIPYAGEKTRNDKFFNTGVNFDLVYPEEPRNLNGINTASNQQMLQINQNTVFKPHCDVEGLTTSSHVLEFDGGGQVILDHDANVHLVPRGNNPENDGPLSSGIYIAGAGKLYIGDGATMNITPKVDTIPYIGTYNYAPSAIVMTGSGSVNIERGGNLLVSYPDLQTGNNGHGFSLPDGDGVPSGTLAFTGGGTLHAYPYSTLKVDGSNPTNVVDDSGNGTWGSLVSFGSYKSGVEADKNSTVDLSVAGTQPITLFQSGPGTPITVDDPKEFKLYCAGNKYANPGEPSCHTLLASGGVGIQGNHVDYHDFPKGKDQDFGQFSQVVLPGGAGAFKSYNGSTTTGVPNLIPYAYSGTTEQEDDSTHPTGGVNPKGVKLIDNSINSASTTDNGSGYSFWYSTGTPTRLYVNKTNDVPGLDISNGFEFTGVPEPYVEGVHAGQRDGSDDKLHFDNSRIISGYAQPYSYIRINKKGNLSGRPISAGVTYDDTISKGAPAGEPMHYNSSGTAQAYDPFDNYQYHNDYEAIADKSGFWQCKIPNGVDPNDLVATSHTFTVADSQNAAREVDAYTQGMLDNSRKPDKIANSKEFYHNQKDFPQGTYPTISNGYDPTRVDDDPTDTDDDDASYQNGNQIIPVTHDLFKNDRNAGYYFWAGRLYGIYNKQNLDTDNSIYSMPRPFIVGYLTATTSPLDFKGLSSQIHGLNYADYLPSVKDDASRATVYYGKLDNTMSLLNSLAYSAEDPYVDLQSTADNLASSAMAAQDADQDIQARCSDVSNVNANLSNISSALSGYANDISNAGDQYNKYYKDAEAALSSGNNIDKQIDLIQAKAVESQVEQQMDVAKSDIPVFTSESLNTSLDNQSASIDSNSVSSYCGIIRPSASNSEAIAFSSVASSYNAWGADNVSDASEEKSLVDDKYALISNYGNAYQKYMRSLDAISGANLAAVQSEKTALSQASAANSDALSQAGTDSASASSALSDAIVQSSALSADLSSASSEASKQSGDVQTGAFDSAAQANAATMGSYLGSAAEQSAVKDSLSADNAWDDIATLAHRVRRNNKKAGRSAQHSAQMINLMNVGVTLPRTFGRQLIHPVSRPVSTGQVNIVYHDLDHDRDLITLAMSGQDGSNFDFSYYEKDLPVGYHFVNASHNGNVIRFNAKQPQQVVINIAHQTPAVRYGEVRIHFVEADSVHGNDPQQWTVVPHSHTEVMSGRVGKLFSPAHYEDFTPVNTEFVRIVKGNDIAGYQSTPQDVYIAVRPLE